MVTLDRLVNVLGSYGVRLRFCSIPRSTELSSVMIPEVATDRAVVGDVLLATGARSIREAVRWAVAAKAVAVLVRSADDKTSFAGEGEAIAVLVIDPAVSWSELAAVVYGLVLEGRETESGRGPTDLFALADSLADVVGGAVTISDQLLRVLAYSRGQQHADPARTETILNRQAAGVLRTLLESRGVFAHLAVSDDPLFVAADAESGMSGRTVVAVRAGRELLGTVWVACSSPLAADRLTALADGARTVALHMLRSRASADLERQVESEWVTRLLDGTADAVVLVNRLGLPAQSLRVIAVHTRMPTESHAALLLAFEAVTTGFGWSRPGRSALAANTVYTLLPAEEVAQARRWVSDLAAVLPARMTMSAGISAVAAADELPAARREADECLGLAETDPSDGPTPATVRYRLRKMAEVTHLGLDDAGKRFAMMIELASTDVSGADKR